MAKKLVVTPYHNVPTSELEAMKRNLIQKANNLLKKHQYFEVEMIKEDLEVINAQLEINRRGVNVV